MNKKAIWQIAFEFLSVVFAVLLALGLNSYKESKDLESEGELLRARIVAECQRNLIQLDSVITQNETFNRYIDSLNSLESLEIKGFNISIASDLLTKSGWNFTQSSKSFSYMDEEFLNSASVLYERQDYYMAISNQMFEKLGDVLMADPEAQKTVRLIHYYLVNLNSTALELRSTYTNFLRKYNDSPK